MSVSMWFLYIAAIAILLQSFCSLNRLTDYRKSNDLTNDYIQAKHYLERGKERKFIVKVKFARISDNSNKFFYSLYFMSS